MYIIWLDIRSQLQQRIIMAHADVTLQIDYDFHDPEKSIIRTNAKREAVEEILGEWLRAQMGRGADESRPKKKDKYCIVIGLAVSDDTFTTTSDTGNKSLTCGIVRDVCGRLRHVQVLSV